MVANACKTKSGGPTTCSWLHKRTMASYFEPLPHDTDMVRAGVLAEMPLTEKTNKGSLLARSRGVAGAPWPSGSPCVCHRATTHTEAQACRHTLMHGERTTITKYNSTYMFLITTVGSKLGSQRHASHYRWKRMGAVTMCACMWVLPPCQSLLVEVEGPSAGGGGGGRVVHVLLSSTLLPFWRCVSA